MLCSTRRLAGRHFDRSLRFLSVTRPSVRIYLNDNDVTPAVQFEPGVSIMQVRDFLGIRGGGLKHRGDTDNVVLKERPAGYDNGDYVLVGYQGQSPSAHLHLLQQQQQMQLQHLYQLLQQQPPQSPSTLPPPPPPPPHVLSSRSNLPPINSPLPPPPQQTPQHFSQTSYPHTQSKQSDSEPSTRSTPPKGGKLAQELGIDADELEMFPWLVDENNTKPFM